MNATVKIGAYTVYRYQIIGTTTWVHEVYEPTSFMGRFEAGHSTIRSEQDANGNTIWLGRIGTRGLTEELHGIPSGEERVKAVRAYHAAQYQQAYDIIAQAFPVAATSGRADHGEIETVEPRS